MLESAIRETANEPGLSSTQVQEVIDKLLAKGVISCRVAGEEMTVDQWAAEFATIKQTIKRRDLYAAAREARERSHRLLEDQGLASLSLLFAHLFADLIEQPDRLLKMAS